jgi:SAM-dependent methyltransferase
MPALETLRQPGASANERSRAWLARATTHRWLDACMQSAAVDVARGSGRYGLFVYPQAPAGLRFQTPNLHTVVHLYRDDANLAGDLRCAESTLPFADESFALIFLGWSFEFARDPVGLAAECARLLEPEGMLLVVGLNPWSPARMRWLFRGLHSWSPEVLRPLLTGLGLEILGCRYLGGICSGGDAAMLDPGGVRSAPIGLLRSGFLLEARRRDPGLTPLRTTPARVVLGTGAHAG